MKATATTQDNMDQSSCSGGGKNYFPNIVEDVAKQERSSGCGWVGDSKTKTKHQKKKKSADKCKQKKQRGKNGQISQRKEELG